MLEYLPFPCHSKENSVAAQHNSRIRRVFFNMQNSGTGKSLHPLFVSRNYPLDQAVSADYVVSFLLTCIHAPGFTTKSEKFPVKTSLSLCLSSDATQGRAIPKPLQQSVP